MEAPAAIRSDGEWSALLRLAGPLAAAYAGTQLMSLTDAVMVGRLGAVALGAVGIGNGIFFALSVLGFGCVLGMDAPVAQAVGAGEPMRAWRALGQSVRLAFLVGALLTAALAASPVVLRVAGVQPAVAAEVRRYLMARAGNVVPLLLFVAGRSYLQAHARTAPIVTAMLVGNLVNFALNAVLIYGDATLARLHLPRIGLPALGVVGSGLASTAASLAMVAVVAQAVRRLEPPHGARDGAPVSMATLLALGLPVGLQMLAEVGMFAIAGVLAGRMSPTAAAAHQIAITIASFTFCITVGVSSAAAVRVGVAVGRGDTPGARRAGLIALATGVGFMACAALVLFAVPAALARLFTDDAQVVRASVPLVLIAALFQLSDGTQSVSAGALRGAGDALAPVVANVVGHYGVGLPIAVVLGFRLGLGATGLWWGLSAGLTAVAVGLAARFLRVSARPIARV